MEGRTSAQVAENLGQQNSHDQQRNQRIYRSWLAHPAAADGTIVSDLATEQARKIMDVLTTAANVDTLHKLKKEKRIPGNRVLAIGGDAWCQAVIVVARAGDTPLGRELASLFSDAHLGLGSNVWLTRREKVSLCPALASPMVHPQPPRCPSLLVHWPSLKTLLHGCFAQARGSSGPVR